ncbi:MAG: hypothetical protein F6K22_08660 [Okeania sp. SIO2F4]|uniref:hypothetical protein n=1 Tax=Okeania sp. SIO2F4 TaxID=2607790 RepID=UPI00142B4EDA|nr:hypothetical protein [Okeania sp. SIO2F4]NES02909.1 hypothetical protein [Okeania sp. SIO2F4]
MSNTPITKIGIQNQSGAINKGSQIGEQNIGQQNNYNSVQPEVNETQALEVTEQKSIIKKLPAPFRYMLSHISFPISLNEVFHGLGQFFK